VLRLYQNVFFWSNRLAVLLRHATPSVLHQRHIGRLL